MRHPASATPPAIRSQPTADQKQSPVFRGLVNGVLLSLAFWVAAGFLAFTLR